jgi:hypothetical protein
MLIGYFLILLKKKSNILISANIFERVVGMRLVNRPVSIGAFASNLNLHLIFCNLFKYKSTFLMIKIVQREIKKIK